MVNKTIIQGRLTATPEIKYVGANIPMLEFTVAWSEKYKDNERKLFLRCKAWRSTAEFINAYFFKGQQIILVGELMTEEWSKDGEKKSRTLLNVEKADFCGSKSEGDKPTQAEDQATGFVDVPDDAVDDLPF